MWCSQQALAEEGYILLAERLRKDSEKLVVQQTIEKHIKAKIDINRLYAGNPELEKRLAASNSQFSRIVWTSGMRRLFTLVERCLQHNEAPLIVGETGSGKTTVCQMHAELLGMKLHMLNCHQHTETSDFLGGLRPVRGKQALSDNLKQSLKTFFELCENSQDLMALIPDASIQELMLRFESVCNEIRQASEDKQLPTSLMV